VAFALTLLLIQFGLFGLTAANPYFIARRPMHAPSIVVNALWLIPAISVVLVGAGLGIRELAPDTLRGVSDMELLITLAGIPAVLGAQLLQSVLLGEGRTGAYNAVDAATTFLTLIGLVLALMVADGGVEVALVIMIGGRALATVACLALLVGHVRGASLRLDRELLRAMLAYGLRAHVAAVLAYLVIRLDLMLVNAYLGPEEAGLYAAAVALGDGLHLLPSVIAINLFARVARGLAVEKTAAVFRSVVIVYGAVCIVAYPLAGPAIALIYGTPFEGAVELFWWLLPGLLCLGLLNILSQYFAGRGFPIQAMLVWFVGLGVNVLINLVFLTEAGTVVAAIASSVAYALLLVLHVRMFARELGGYRTLRPSLGETLGMIRRLRRHETTFPPTR
jgi:O-antigen/teichoic acid export membrane protein